MKNMSVLLSSINSVKDFVNIVSKYECDIDLVSGRYVVDAKSIMGIFSLDLTKPITVRVDKESCADRLFAELEPYNADTQPKK